MAKIQFGYDIADASDQSTKPQVPRRDILTFTFQVVYKILLASVFYVNPLPLCGIFPQAMAKYPPLSLTPWAIQIFLIFLTCFMLQKDYSPLLFVMRISI